MWAVNPNRSRSGPVSAPDLVVAPTSVKGATFERNRRGARAFPDDDVDAEVLHREVQHFLGGSGDAMDLVDKQHVVLDEVGQHQRQGRLRAQARDRM